MHNCIMSHLKQGEYYFKLWLSFYKCKFQQNLCFFLHMIVNSSTLMIHICFKVVQLPVKVTVLIMPVVWILMDTFKHGELIQLAVRADPQPSCTNCNACLTWPISRFRLVGGNRYCLACNDKQSSRLIVARATSISHHFCHFFQT